MADRVISIAPDGTLTALYTDQIDLRAIGKLTVDRASEIEFDHDAQTWFIRFPDGTTVPNFASREDAIACEISLMNEKIGRGL